MKGLLVKIGKVKSVLERDGFWSGMRNVGGKLGKMLKGIFSWPRGEILFVSSGVGDASMYRTDYVAEELKLYGFKTGVVYKDDPFLLFKLRKSKVVVLYRTTCDSKIKKLLEQIDKLRQTLVYDTDDLVFDWESFKKTDAYNNFNELQKKQYEDGVGLEILNSDTLKAVTTTTSFLQEKLSRFGKPVFIVKNKLGKRELKWVREARKKYLRRVKKSSEVRLGYFSGTISHNRDFAVIIPALKVILNKYPNVKLYLVGYLDVKDDFYKEFHKQIVQLPFVPRREHYQNISEIDINLAPLEMTDFCQAKSELKFFEAGIIGIPTIATRNQTFSEAINEESESLKKCVSCLHPKRSGLLAGNTAEWVEKLELLIENKEMRVSIGERARQVVLKKYLTSSGGSKEYYEFLENVT